MSPLVQGIAQAIAQMEGFNTPGSIAQRNNNPGNLRSWPGAGTASGYALFSSLTTGWNALYTQIQTNIGRGLNLYQFFGGGLGYPGYSPSADRNQPVTYANFVAGQVGIDPNTPLNQLDPNTGGTVPTDTTTASDSSNSSDSPVDTSATVDTSTDGSMSTGLMVGLGIAGLLLFWAFWD